MIEERKMKDKNKVRNMKGVKVGRGSAGRSNGRGPGVKQEFDYFTDVKMALTEYLINQSKTLRNLYTTPYGRRWKKREAKG